MEGLKEARGSVEAQPAELHTEEEDRRGSEGGGKGEGGGGGCSIRILMGNQRQSNHDDILASKSGHCAIFESVWSAADTAQTMIQMNV